MPSDFERRAAGRCWATAAQVQLAIVTDTAAALRKAFEAEQVSEDDRFPELACNMVDACAALIDWLRKAPAPSGLDNAEGELVAAAGVYRNAAFAFRSLIDAEPDQRDTRLGVCATMLNQGDDHVGGFIATLRKKAVI